MPDYVSTENRAYVAASGRLRILGEEIEVTAMQPGKINSPAEQIHALGDREPRVLAEGPITYDTLKFTALLAPAQAWMASKGGVKSLLGQRLSGTATYTEATLGTAPVDFSGAKVVGVEVTNAESATASAVSINFEVQPLRQTIG